MTTTEDAASSSSEDILINIKGAHTLSRGKGRMVTNEVLFAGPNELKLQITISRDNTVLELKQAIAEKSDVEADRQRLIYSGALYE
jgi:ubiquilin